MFALPVTRTLYAQAETAHEFDDVLSAADEVSAMYRCYQEWYTQAEALLYSSGTSPDVEAEICEAIEPVLSPPQINYAKDEWFPLSTWRTEMAKYNAAILRIKGVLSE